MTTKKDRYTIYGRKNPVQQRGVPSEGDAALRAVKKAAGKRIVAGIQAVVVVQRGKEQAADTRPTAEFYNLRHA